MIKDRFRTIIDINNPPFRISYQTGCFLTGSCFTDTVGERMQWYKLPVLYNPFGVLYNPASISKNLRMLMHDKMYAKGDLHFHNGLWISMDHDTSFSHPDQEVCLSKINSSLMAARKFLKQCNFLFITLGTAWVYIFKEKAKIVANCHKIPAAAFERRLLNPEEIIADYQALIEEIRLYNPEIQVIYTVSPIRHIKDGAFNNQVSKSILLFTIHKLLNTGKHVHYFPAYEIFMDELRDYRFYAEDMLHPSEQGMAYIWERFCDTYIDETPKTIMAGVEKIHKALDHRPFRTDTPDYQSFMEHTRQQIAEMQKNWSFLDFSDEIQQLNSKTPGTICEG